MAATGQLVVPDSSTVPGSLGAAAGQLAMRLRLTRRPCRTGLAQLPANLPVRTRSAQSQAVLATSDLHAGAVRLVVRIEAGGRLLRPGARAGRGRAGPAAGTAGADRRW